MPSNAFVGLMKAVLEKNVPFRFAAKGRSMFPFIRDGDLITISPLPMPLPLRPGDVVTFVNPSCNRLMAHRIIDVSPDGHLIKGDNNSIPDGRIHQSDIIGRVVRVEHRGRRVRFGLGAERVLIAWLSRCCWLTPLVQSTERIMKPFRRQGS